MALCYSLQSLPAVHRVATPFASGFPHYCPTPHAWLHKNRIKEPIYTGSSFRSSVERITTPSRHWCRSAVSHPLATRATGNGSSMEEAVGVVIVDHGSKRAEANEMLEEFASMYRLAEWPFLHCKICSVQTCNELLSLYTGTAASTRLLKLPTWSWPSQA